MSGPPVSLAASAEHEAAVEQIVAAGRSAWPTMQAAASDVRAAVRAMLADIDQADRALVVGHAADVFLAAACGAGHREALATFEERHLAEVASYVARIDAAPEFADEVRQRLREKLFVGEGGERPKIAGYGGRGPLGGWVRVVAIRTARDLVRARGRGRGETATTDEAAAFGVDELDPELHYMKKHYATEFRAAFSETLMRLDPQRRNVLRLHFLEGMSSAAIGEMYGVSGAAVRLWIKQYRADLLAETRRMLAERLRLEPSELSSVLALVQSQMDASISKLLKSR
jgi:RNA polymerase sigma-70 factor (ECF subfamily)